MLNRKQKQQRERKYEGLRETDNGRYCEMQKMVAFIDAIGGSIGWVRVKKTYREILGNEKHGKREKI